MGAHPVRTQHLIHPIVREDLVPRHPEHSKHTAGGFAALSLLLLLAASLGVGSTAAAPEALTAQPLPAQLPLELAGPDSFLVTLETTRGRVVLKSHRDWAPLGSARLYHLVEGGYYNGTVVYRIGPTKSFEGGFVAQFGIGNSEAVNKAWEASPIGDEPVREHNRLGMVSFARGGPKTRSVELGMNLATNAQLDTVTYEGIVGFPPVAEIVSGMSVLQSLNRKYGNAVFDQWDSVFVHGREYLDRAYPGLDRVVTARVSRTWPKRFRP